LATNTIINSIAAGIAPILGGLCADFFAGRELAWTLVYSGPSGEYAIPTLNLQQWDFFFVLAFLIGLYSIHRLALVKEQGEVEEEIVFEELMTEVKGQVRIFSSVEGLRQMFNFPFGIIKNLMYTERKSGNHK
jgi:hypothetical protein